MARMPREQYEGATYHIYNRGDQGSMIFAEDAGKAFFIRHLGEAALRFNARCLAYCVMTNHYHVLLKTTELGISRIMHLVGSAYGSYLAQKEWNGHVFAGRFRSRVVDDEEYLLAVSDYIHLNPVSACLTPSPAAYPWSAYHFYRMASGPRWLDIDTIPRVRRMTGGAPEYADWLELQPPKNCLFEKLLWKPSTSKDALLRALSLTSSASTDLSSLLTGVCEHFRLAGLSSGNMPREMVSIAQQTFAYLAREYLAATYAEIAELSDLSPQAARNANLKMRKAIAGPDENARKRASELDQLALEAFGMRQTVQGSI
ncbi:MAG: transposase [Candidatus Geothermincolia bacterium]